MKTLSVKNRVFPPQQDISVEVLSEMNKYSELKEFIKSLSQKSAQQRLEEALGQLHLDGRKPSQFMRHIKSKLLDVGLEPTDEVLKHKIIKAMPSEAVMSLTASQSLPLQAFTEIADNLYDLIERSSGVCHVNSNKETHSSSSNKSGTNQNYGQHKVSENKRNNHKNFSLQPYHPDQKPKICRAHLYFAEKARTCKSWCRWPGNKPRIVDSRESSRANSPVRSHQEN